MDEELLFLKKYIDNEIQGKLEELVLTRKDLATIKEHVESILNTANKILVNTENGAQLLTKIVRVYSETTKRIFQQLGDIKEAVNRIENNSVMINNRMNKLFENLDSIKNNLTTMISDLRNEVGDAINRMLKIRDLGEEVKNNLLSIIEVLNEANNAMRQEATKFVSLLKEISGTNNNIVKAISNTNTVLAELANSLRTVSETLNVVVETQKSIVGTLSTLVEEQKSVMGALEKLSRVSQQLYDNQKAIVEFVKKHDSELTSLSEKVGKLLEKVASLEESLKREADKRQVEEGSD